MVESGFINVIVGLGIGIPFCALLIFFANRAADRREKKLMDEKRTYKR